MNKIKFFQEIQGFLSVGYIYLIVMGILNETLYYNQIGIDILNYSSILDVLISPIARLTSNIVFLTIFIITLFFVFKSPSILVKHKDKNWFKRLFKKIDLGLTNEQVKSSLLKSFLFMISIGLFGFYIGSGIGKGERLLKKIEKEEVAYSDRIKFINGDESKVEIVGINSAYIFYLEKENKTVQITPISGIIKSIEKKNKKH
ncbi:hypothetical protein [Aquimarina pacifica]|uniref:hypothetical protein n=1 Tax=Aquimarina pacifica TaxID=1296415 RepID=UPI0004704700|nr:hypothetical protein [Aquimarina pacifica]